MTLKNILIVSCSLFALPLLAQHTELNKENTKITLTELLGELPGPNGERFKVGMKHGTMEVLIYAPEGKDHQTPHTKDEVYIVVTGSGIFFDGKQRYPFKPGDVLYVPANTEHKFENFSDDFVTWVVFYGPEGGEK
jgi:mannose-6-phosphate isomerase-like protein (cupin superfamily)